MTGLSESELRGELAAAYRLIALFGRDDHVATHLSAGLPDIDCAMHLHTHDGVAASARREVKIPSNEAVARVGSAMKWDDPNRFSLRTFWPAMLRKAERECTGFDA